MTTTTHPKAGYWIIAVIAFIWNTVGVWAYLVQAYMTDEAKQLIPEAERALYENIPAWVTAAFAVAVFGGLLGSLALLIKRKAARMLFLISLVGILLQMSYTLFMSNVMAVKGASGMIMPIMVIIIGIFLLNFSKKAITNGWLK